LDAGSGVISLELKDEDLARREDDPGEAERALVQSLRNAARAVAGGRAERAAAGMDGELFCATDELDGNVFDGSALAVSLGARTAYPRGAFVGDNNIAMWNHRRKQDARQGTTNACDF
jgi:hypothetical protein